MQPIEEIYRAHSQTVYRYLLSLTHNADAAEELTQETFYRAVKSIDRFDRSCKVSTWLCAIAKNTFAEYLRKQKKRADIEDIDDVMSLSPSPEDETVKKSDNLALLQKLHMLENDMREVLYLRLFGNLSFREIGDILSHSENWARVTYYRGKEKLKKESEEDE